VYAIVISKSAAKDLEKISRIHLAGLIEAIDGLAENPRPAGCKKLKGSTEPFWRIRKGEYRVVYQISDQVKIVDIRRVRHRREVYE
jgi:mRNA interferase RelE/StbE